MHLIQVRQVDHISEADDQNEKCKLLNHEIPNIHFTGGGTFTAGALKEAKVLCVCVCDYCIFSQQENKCCSEMFGIVNFSEFKYFLS